MARKLTPAPASACSVCGAPIERRPGSRGPLPRLCPRHTEADPRLSRREKAKKLNPDTWTRFRELSDSARLAAAMALHPDPKAAAALAALPGADIPALVKLARRHHRDLIDGDRQGIGKRLLTSLAICNELLLGEIVTGTVHPRDLSNVLMRLSMVRSAVVGSELVADNVTEISVSIDDSPAEPKGGADEARRPAQIAAASK